MRSMRNVREAADYMGVDCTPAEIANIAGIGLMLERMASMRPPVRDEKGKPKDATRRA